jgi:hypothetical protein
MEAGTDDNAPYDFRKLFKEAGHKGPLSADLPIPLSPRPAVGGSQGRVSRGRNGDHGREYVCAILLTSANSFSRIVKSLDSQPFRLHRLTTVFAAETTS